MDPTRGDVVRSSDPFKLGSDQQRPWLLVNNETHPFADEQFIAVAVSTREHDDAVELAPDVWEVGGVPERSFVAPWAVHSPRIEDLVTWQGRVETAFVDEVVENVHQYLDGHGSNERIGT